MMLELYITYHITYIINSKSLDGTWKNMFEKEIKKVKDRTTFIITLGKNDGEIHEGTCFIYYPHEIEEIQLNISSLEEENQTLKSQLEEMTSKNKSLETQINSQSHKHETQQQRIQQLEDENKRKDEEINQLQMERDDLTNQVQGLNASLTSMRIQHNEEMDDMISKYNGSVDMIHAIISTTSLLKGDIENMSFSKRTFSFKNNLNSLFEERNMNNLIEQHLINEDSRIPEKTTKKQ